MPVKWEDLDEQLFWQNTPLTRSVAFPNRVAVYRSTKTQAMYTNQFDRVNAVCDWLETMGYESGNLMDLSFDNVTVTAPAGTNQALATLFSDAMESGTNGWTATGLWHQSKDLSASPSNSWAYNNGSNYVTGARNTGVLSPGRLALQRDVRRVAPLQELVRNGRHRHRLGPEARPDFHERHLVVHAAPDFRHEQAVGLARRRPRLVRRQDGVDPLLLRLDRRDEQPVSRVVHRRRRGVRTPSAEDGHLQRQHGIHDELDGRRPVAPLAHAIAPSAGPTAGCTTAQETNYSTGARTAGSLISRWIDLGEPLRRDPDVQQLVPHGGCRDKLGPQAGVPDHRRHHVDEILPGFRHGPTVDTAVHRPERLRGQADPAEVHLRQHRRAQQPLRRLVRGRRPHLDAQRHRLDRLLGPLGNGHERMDRRRPVAPGAGPELQRVEQLGVQQRRRITAPAHGTAARWFHAGSISPMPPAQRCPSGAGTRPRTRASRGTGSSST